MSLSNIQPQIASLSKHEQVQLQAWLNEQISERHDMPQRLHRYCGSGAVEGLEKGELLFSSPTELNDPFEFLPSLAHLPASSPTELRNATANTARRSMTKNWFVASFSSEAHNIRMWDHYGGNHSGIMLTLNFSVGVLADLRNTNHLMRVRYGDSSRMDVREKVLAKSFNGEDLKALATTKGAAWAPEAEWRLMLHAGECYRDAQAARLEGQVAQIRLHQERQKAFLPIDDACIEKVTLGYHSSDVLLNTVLQIRRTKQARWLVARTRLTLDKFSFEDEIVDD